MKLNSIFQTYRRELPLDPVRIDVRGHISIDPDSDMLKLFERPDGTADLFMTSDLPALGQIFIAGQHLDHGHTFPDPTRPTQLMVPTCAKDGVPGMIFVGHLGVDGRFAPGDGWF